MAERAGLGGGHRQMVVPAQSGRAISVASARSQMRSVTGQEWRGALGWG